MRAARTVINCGMGSSVIRRSPSPLAEPPLPRPLPRLPSPSLSEPPSPPLSEPPSPPLSEPSPEITTPPLAELLPESPPIATAVLPAKYHP